LIISKVNAGMKWEDAAEMFEIKRERMDTYHLLQRNEEGNLLLKIRN